MIATVGALVAGGLVGTFARAGANRAYPAPGSTLAVNLAGCFLIGLFDAALLRRGAPANYRLLLVTGFCGAFTTFSSLIFELDMLLRESPAKAFAYLALSVVAGLALLRLGAAAGRLA